MAGIRYQYKVTDTEDTHVWEWRLIDTTYVGSATNATLGPDGFTLSYGRRNDKQFATIKESRVVCQFACETQEDFDFIDEIAQVQEDRYYVELYRDNDLFWRGILLQDLIQVPFDKPAQVELTAICGLARLKGINRTIGQFDNLLEVIISMLKELDPNFLWAGSDDFLRTSVRWFEDQMWTGSVPNGLDALAYTRLQRPYVEYTIDDRGTTTYRDWDEILDKILTAFGARIFQAYGYWIIEQIDEVEQTPSRYNVYTRDYSYSSGNPSGASGISSTGNLWTTRFTLNTAGRTDRLKSGGLYQYYPAYKDAQIQVELDEETFFNSFYRVPAPADEESLVQISQGSTFQIVTLTQYHKVVNSSASTQVYWWRQLIEIKLDDGGGNVRYLSPLPTGGYQWVSVQTNILQGQVQKVIPGSTTLYESIGGLSSQSPFKNNFGLPATPFAGTLSVEYFVAFYDSNFVLNPNVTLGTYISTDDFYNERGMKVWLTGGGTTSGYYRLFKKIYKWTNDNADVDSTDGYDFGKTFIGDAISPVIYNGSFEVYSVNASAWERSSDWQRRGVGAKYEILDLLTLTALQMFDVPRRKFDLSYRGTLRPERAFVLGSRAYFWNYLALDARRGDVTTEAFELNNPDNSHSQETELESPSDNPNLIGVVDYGQTILNDGKVDDNTTDLGQDWSGLLTSLTVSELKADLGYTGDGLRIYNPGDGSYDDVVLTDDALTGDTSISIASQAPTKYMPQGSKVMRLGSEQAFKAHTRESVSPKLIGDAEVILGRDTGFKTSSGALATWLDASGNSNNYTASSAPTVTRERPFFVQFDGVDDDIRDTGYTLASPWSMAFLAYFETANDGTIFAATDIEISKSGTTVTVNTTTTPASDTFTLTTGAWVVFQFEMNVASSRYRNNLASWQALSIDAETMTSPVIGTDGGGNPINFKLAEVRIFGKALSNDEWDKVYAELKAKL